MARNACRRRPVNLRPWIVLATTILLSIGVGAGLILKQHSLMAVSRIAGGAIAICGLMLFWT